MRRRPMWRATKYDDVPSGVTTVEMSDGRAKLQWSNTTGAWALEAEFWVKSPGSSEFVAELTANDIPFMVLTNNSIYTQRDLRARLSRTGLEVPEAAIWTSALATARFLDSQRPGGSAFVIGEAGLTTALHEIGYVLTDRDPDYVVLGETRTYSFEAITKAIRLVKAGSIA